ncbi:hypothetical protein V6N12_028623 [Hibiscus sabdariffa]|uniref:Uncharacterized protein n=1 Tax=Hibiscus sabdariffa TaxID=183260 RepID=A0ABR2F6D2_9ROSI
MRGQLDGGRDDANNWKCLATRWVKINTDGVMRIGDSFAAAGGVTRVGKIPGYPVPVPDLFGPGGSLPETGSGGTKTKSKI